LEAGLGYLAVRPEVLPVVPSSNGKEFGGDLMNHRT